MTPTLAVSPLSPERACAMSSEPDLHDEHLDLRLHDGLVDQRRPVRHDLLDLRTAAGESGDARRAVEHERRDLAREALDRALSLAAHADAQLHLRRVARRRRRAGRASPRRRRTR